MELIICDHDIVETLVIEKSVIDYCKGRNVQVLIRCCTNWQELTCLLSDLDFGVQAYQLGIPYFNMKPITHEKVYHALKMIEES